ARPRGRPAAPQLDGAVDVTVLPPLAVEHRRLRGDLDVLGEGGNNAVVPRLLDETAELAGVERHRADPQEAMRRPERSSQSSCSSSDASAIRASLPQRRQWMNAGSRPIYVLSHLGHRVGQPETKRFAVRCSVWSAVSRITVADSGNGFAFVLAFFDFASFMSAGHCTAEPLHR